MIVFCSGMARAGSTYQYNLVRAAVETCGCGWGEGFADSWNNSSLERWRRHDQLHVLKSHELHPDVTQWLADDTARLCYIYRDLRDVAVSLRRKYPNADLMGALRWSVALDDQVHGMEKCLVQKYEDVVTDATSALDQIVNYLGLSLDASDYERIVALTSVAKAREAIESFRKSPKQRLQRALKNLLRRGEPAYHSRTLLHEDHISERGGEYGGWRTQLSAGMIEAIQTQFGAWLVDRGYDLNQ